jgi:hypothetical protein
MALILDGNGLIQGLDAGGLPSGSVNADTLASTLDLSSKTMTFGNVSASGITFPATQSASGNANTLDDFEEGTWTATFAGSTKTTTGYYVKIGKLVYVSIYSGGMNVTSSTNAVISGLPFTVGEAPTGDYTTGTLSHCDWTANGGGNGHFNINATTFTAITVNTVSVASTQTGNPRYVMMSGSYYTAS